MCQCKSMKWVLPRSHKVIPALSSHLSLYHPSALQILKLYTQRFLQFVSVCTCFLSSQIQARAHKQEIISSVIITDKMELLCSGLWILYNVKIKSLHFRFLCRSKTTQRNKQIAMGRKKFNMDPKKVGFYVFYLIWQSCTSLIFSL